MKGQKIEKYGQKHQILDKSPYIFVQRKRATDELQQFNNKKYFQMNRTCQNDPGPPSPLKE